MDTFCRVLLQSIGGVAATVDNCLLCFKYTKVIFLFASISSLKNAMLNFERRLSKNNKSGQFTFGAGFNVPSALPAVFLFASVRHPERETVATSLCAFWLPLELGERIELLGLAVHRVFRLKSGGFDGENANGTNIRSQGQLSRNEARRKQSSLSMCVIFSGGTQWLKCNP